MKRLTANLLIKIMSLAIAFVIWVAIMNISNPVTSGFVNVSVAVKNEDFILNQNKSYNILGSRIVRVNYMVEQSEQARVRQNDFDVYVDLKEMGANNELPIHVSVIDNSLSSISNVYVEPDELHVEIVDMTNNEFAVQHELIGELANGHSVGSVILSPNVVYISGSNEAMENIDHVSIEIPIINKEENFSGVASINLYNKDGMIISKDGYSFSAEEINYSVVVNTWVNISLNAVVEGSVKSGYNYGGVEVEPNNIIVNGPRSIVQEIYTIDLPIINIEGLEKSEEYTFSTADILPIGLSTNVQSIKAKVTVNSNVLNRSNSDFVEVGPHIENESEAETEDVSETENANDLRTEHRRETEQ